MLLSSIAPSKDSRQRIEIIADKDQEKFEQSNSGQKAKSLEDDHELEDDVEPCEPAQNEGNYTPTQEEVMSAMTSAFSKYLVGYLFTQQHDIQ